MFYPDDPQPALKRNIGAPCQAMSEEKTKLSVLPFDQIEHCLGSPKYRKYSEIFPTAIGHSSCMAPLLFNSTVDPPSSCDTSLVSALSNEQVTNITLGEWFIASA